MIWIVQMALVLASQTGGATGAAAKELEEIEQGLAKAWVEKDRAFLAGVLSKEWAVVDAAGDVRSKEDVLGEFDRGELRVDAAKVEDLDIREFGDMAIVRGRSHSTGSYQGVSMSVTLRFTDVFVRRDGRWVSVASHATALAPGSQ